LAALLILHISAYLNEGDTNVVVLDWRAYSNLPCYPSAVINTWQAGKCLAKVLQDVATWTGTPGQFFNRLHIIGFSLGAHVAGFASSYLKPFRIGRITGTILMKWEGRAARANNSRCDACKKYAAKSSQAALVCNRCRVGAAPVAYSKKHGLLLQFCVY
jgi:Lipase